jgi:predicted AAA+ superfamily ATPase
VVKLQDVYGLSAIAPDYPQNKELIIKSLAMLLFFLLGQKEKINFFDTGLVCALLGIRTREQLEGHFLKGSLFEHFMIVETLKQYFHRGIRPQCYYWRDNTGHEIDLLVEDGGKIIPVEIKSGRTIQSDFLKPRQYFS